MYVYEVYRRYTDFFVSKHDGEFYLAGKTICDEEWCKVLNSMIGGHYCRRFSKEDINIPILNCMWREVVERKQTPTGREECDYHTKMSLVEMEKEILSLKNAVGKQQVMLESMSNQIKKLFGMFAKIKHAMT